MIWLVVYLPLWKTMEFVNGKDDIPYIMENKIDIPNHQSVIHFPHLFRGCTFT